ncbi:hypothetical protein PSR25_14195 [Acinetobacter pittii]|uniref:hypothetical protein n=1 Tax=Acinetobacter pittii TaxID=48296 RepID=UPI002663D932|nr:hypothetical protein [Acinetobacter pittii]WSE36351.1 hypothetical protein PSR25_14195 [Acinetobacter pittii]
MGLFKAPEGVTSVSVAGVELEVKDGFVEADENIWPFVEPLGFTVGKPDDLVALREAAAKAAEAAEAAAKEAAENEKLAKAKAEEEAKAKAQAEAEAADKAKAEAEAAAAVNASASAGADADKAKGKKA